MKVKIYVVTYNNNLILNSFFLKSLKESAYSSTNTEVFIIDNYGNAQIDPPYQGLATVITNSLRPSFSTGHLSRNWNLSIINGFKDLDKPDCDLVLCIQNDTALKPSWESTLRAYAGKYKYITQGIGDQFQMFTADSIKNVGLYDERFCGIGHQEGDYFLRAAKFYGDFVSINDPRHARLFNSIGSYEIIEETPSGAQGQETSHLMSFQYHNVSGSVFRHKWNTSPTGDLKNHDVWAKDIPKINQLSNNYITYPYFEDKLLQKTFIDQKYIVPAHYLMKD